MSKAYLEISNLNKTFKNDLLKSNHLALDNLSCSFDKGECTGFLGHNGAGKTTTIRMILGLMTPDSGMLTIQGHKINTSARNKIGYMAEINKLPTNLTPAEILKSHLKLYSYTAKLSKSEINAKVQDKLTHVGLQNHQTKKISSLSKGMGRRLAWAMATIHEPEFLILDEPSSGLDPLGRRQMLDWITEEKKRGTTIMLCTHELNQINQLCDNFHILNKGKLVLSSKKDEGVASLSSENNHLDWRHNYNLHLSGASETTLQNLGESNGLLPWHGFKQEGYLSILGFAEYTDASSWMIAALQSGLIVVRFGDQVFLDEEELLPYFEGGDK